ncbi:MAG TPA: SDR family oxidoreductase [Streptosporangiaceae bacterium]|nr:SDR family oxidoreductase [Streptosporangiaceae bacterium]
MQIKLTGRQALVTGSTSGMGYWMARALAMAGASVVVHGRSDQAVAAARAAIERDVPGATVSGFCAELGDTAAVGRLIDAVPEADILVSNTGPTPSPPVFEMTVADWQRYVDTYVTAAVLLGRHYLASMIGKRWGRMLFGAGVTCSYSPGEPAVAASMTAWLTCKAALVGLSRSLAEIAAGSGVTVNAFIPGPTHTEDSYMARAKPGPGQGRSFEAIEREFFEGPGLPSLLHRFIHPQEVAALVSFLASDQASAITGAAIRVDGGIIRSIP